jgi:ubiquinone/menaquinone biosynthesis C-methylase UbiE
MATGETFMAEPQIRFADGAAYEQYMGAWSRLAGRVFLDWLAPPVGLHWIDVGCGNGAFTELLVERCAPASIDGVDPSEDQLAFARAQPAGRLARYHKGDAMALPFASGVFDAAVMALVIFFVPNPAKGLAEMARVVKPGGSVSAYAWDVVGGGLPGAPIQSEMRAMGIDPPRPPSFEISRIEALQRLWKDSGLIDLETREITITRTFVDFEDFWRISLLAPGIGPFVAKMSTAEAGQLKERVRTRLPADAAGRITYSSRAYAIKGCVKR